MDWPLFAKWPIKTLSRSWCLKPKAILLFTLKMSVSFSLLRKPLSTKSRKILRKAYLERTWMDWNWLLWLRM